MQQIPDRPHLIRQRLAPLAPDDQKTVQAECLQIRNLIFPDHLQNHFPRLFGIPVLKRVGGVFRNDQNLVLGNPEIFPVEPEENISFQHQYDQSEAGEVFRIPVLVDPDLLLHAERIEGKRAAALDFPCFPPLEEKLIVSRPELFMLPRHGVVPVPLMDLIAFPHVFI